MHYTEAKTLLTGHNSMNIYRGCTHGCIYCDSRSLCYNFTHPFEDVGVKINAPELLERVLRSKRKKIMIGTGSMSDPYQPCERKTRLMRQCLELIEKYGFGATVITKSDLVLRDIDLFESINNGSKSVLQMTLTIADSRLSKIIEPNVCPTERRYEVLKKFRQREIPCVVWMTPLLPFLTDTRENFVRIMEYCLDAGVKGIICFDIGMTLRSGNRDYYYRALDKHFPGLSAQYKRKYGTKYEVVSDQNTALMQIFHDTCEKYGILHTPESCFNYLRDMPENSGQLSLF